MKQIIGIDLSVLNRVTEIGPTTHVQPECPGALLRVTLEDRRNFARNGMKFAQDDSHIPTDGYGDARTLCGAPVQRIPPRLKGPDGTPYKSVEIRYYGLCEHCSMAERVNRDMLKKRFTPEPKVGGR